MNRNCIKKVIAAVSLIACIGPASSVWAQAPLSLLISYRYRLVQPPDINIAVENLVYHDGLVLLRFTDVGTGKATLQRCQATGPELQAVWRSLVRNRIGQLVVKSCNSMNPFPSGASYFDVALDWYGKPARENHLRFNEASGVIDTCPDRVSQLVGDLQSLVSLANCTTSEVPPVTP